jgi:hypothetical protein
VARERAGVRMGHYGGMSVASKASPVELKERGAGAPQKAPFDMWRSCGRERLLSGIEPKLWLDTSSACNANALVIWCYPIMEMDQ